MGTHFGVTTKEVADDIAKVSNKAYTTYVKNGIKRYSWTYLSSGTFKTGIFNPTCDIFIVAGGGGGGNANGGGGGAGAGGMVVSSGENISAGSYTITVGAGGTAARANVVEQGTSGTNSSVNLSGVTTAIGGGGGGGDNTTGLTGGSGGGGGRNTGPKGIGTTGQGADGGTPSDNQGGGGGGAGAVGADSTSATAGWGGRGKTNSYRTGADVYYAGGGGGGAESSGVLYGQGGAGGGGNGGNGGGGISATNGTDGLGGGGGASGDWNTPTSAGLVAGTGGSGIVVIKFPTG